MAESDVEVKFGASIEGLQAGVFEAREAIEGLGESVAGPIEAFKGLGEAIMAASVWAVAPSTNTFASSGPSASNLRCQ